ncbi:MAG: hypothetical protein SPI46_06040 [Eubacteriales bacterium]|nr:hypothetical protein [Eubacteriales bacterium]
MKKKNKKENAPVNATPKTDAINVTPYDEDVSGLSITKSERAPIPTSRPVSAPVQRPVTPQPSQQATPVEYAVMRPVSGGLQPIIAPKGQVQLNPVVVPVAFVPYATQNQPMLQIDKKPAAPADKPLPEVKDQPLDKKAARAAKVREKSPEFVGEEESAGETAIKKNKTKNRVFSAILFVITLGIFAFAVLNYFAPKLGITSIVLAPGQPEIIGGWMNFNASDIVGQIPLFAYTALYAIALATLIVEFVGICNGKGYKIWISALIMLLVSAACALVCALVGRFASYNVPLNPVAEGSFAWRLVMVTLLLFVFSLIFMPRKVKPDDDDLSDLI